MSDEKPEYRVYKSRRSPSGWLRNRSGSDQFKEERFKPGKAKDDKPPQDGGGRPKKSGRTPGRPRKYGKPGIKPPKPTWRRVLFWVAVAIAGWLSLSLVLFMISAQLSGKRVRKADKAALTSSGSMLTSANTILALGSDKRKNEAGRGRADSIMLMRFDGGKSAKLSIPRDTRVAIPGYGPNKINAAYAYGGPALMIKTIEFNFPPIKINHVLLVNFRGFRSFVDAMGGVTMNLDNCIHSEFDGKVVKLSKGKHHLSGEQALQVVRVRKNQCATAENDLTRAGRQQEFINSVRSRMFSPMTFLRLPWVAWNAPKAVDSDMKGPGLLGLFVETERVGKTKPEIMPVDPIPFSTDLHVKDPQYKAAIDRFLNP